MKDLEQLKERILQEIHDEFSQKLAVATKVEEERLSHANARFSKQEMASKISLKKAAKSQLERQEQAILNKSNKDVLQVKRNLLNQLYSEAITILSSWSGETFLQYIEGVLNNLKIEGQFHLQFGQESIDKLNDSQKSKLAQAYPSMVIEQESVAKKAGFILKKDGIDYNYFFDELVEDLKNDFSPTLAKLAFEQ